METRGYGDNVRVVCKPASNTSCDLTVQMRKAPTESWVVMRVFNDVDDVYAAEGADELAAALQTQARIHFEVMQ